MAKLNIQSIIITQTILAFLQIFSGSAQITSPCTTSMMNNFIPCVGSIMGSSRNGGSSATSSACCDTFKSTMSKSMDCACLIITGNVPLPSFVSQALAITLPQACGSSMPLQCKSSGVVLPPPGPALFAPPPPPKAISPLQSPVSSPDISPVASPPVGSSVSKALVLVAAPAEAPAEVLAPSAAPDADVAHIRPVFTQSASSASTYSAPLTYIVFSVVAIMGFNYYQVV